MKGMEGMASSQYEGKEDKAMKTKTDRERIEQIELDIRNALAYHEETCTACTDAGGPAPEQRCAYGCALWYAWEASLKAIVVRPQAMQS